MCLYNRVQVRSVQCGGTRVLRVGDVVCVWDDGLPYFARIDALLVDALCVRTAALQWLVPTAAARQPHEFDADSFVRGPIDHTLHSVDTLQFVARPTTATTSSTTERLATQPK